MKFRLPTTALTSFTAVGLAFRPCYSRFKPHIHRRTLAETMAVSNGIHKDSGFYQFAAFRHGKFNTRRIGHFDTDKQTITPLSYKSGTPLQNLYEVIEVGEKNITALNEPIARSECTLLAPISGRDILAVGKNYAVS